MCRKTSLSISFCLNALKARNNLKIQMNMTRFAVYLFPFFTTKVKRQLLYNCNIHWCKMNNLPTKTIVEIASYLSVSDKLNWACVCKLYIKQYHKTLFTANWSLKINSSLIRQWISTTK